MKYAIEELKNAIKCAKSQDGEAIACTAEWLEMVLEELEQSRTALEEIKEKEWELAGEYTPSYMIAHHTLEGH